MTEDTDTLVVLGRRWNDPHSAKAPFAALREFVIKNDPGGVCGLRRDQRASACEARPDTISGRACQPTSQLLAIAHGNQRNWPTHFFLVKG
jgi:hypothetical protein